MWIFDWLLLLAGYISNGALDWWAIKACGPCWLGQDIQSHRCRFTDQESTGQFHQSRSNFFKQFYKSACHTCNIYGQKLRILRENLFVRSRSTAKISLIEWVTDGQFHEVLHFTEFWWQRPGIAWNLLYMSGSKLEVAKNSLQIYNCSVGLSKHAIIKLSILFLLEIGSFMICLWNQIEEKWCQMCYEATYT